MFAEWICREEPPEVGYAGPHIARVRAPAQHTPTEVHDLNLRALLQYPMIRSNLEVMAHSRARH